MVLVNAAAVRNLPGRKTDVSDAAWLADLGAHGLVKASFVPPAPIRALRDLTRTRTVITRERTREVQRLEKLLEDAGIKLSSVASEITGVSGRAMLETLIAGQRDPATLADLAQRRMRSKIPALTEALTAFGATKRQVLFKAELTYAFAQIMAGLNQTIMLSLSMVVIAALVGADGLGVPVVRALNSVNTALGFESGFVIVVVAIVLDRMLRKGATR